jgi:hypothetical protein
MKYLVVLCVLFIGENLFSQDQLFKKDNTKLDVKILEINPTEIKYKLFNYEDGPTITILKNEVALIIYKNGMHEVISTTSETPVVKEQEAIKNVKLEKWELQRKREADRNAELEMADSLEKTGAENALKTKNTIGFNMLEPMNGCIGVTFLREFANHYLNAYVPINIGVTTPFANQQTVSTFHLVNDNYNIANYKFTRKTIEVGLGINFQANSTKQSTYFVGPLVEVAQYVGTFDEYVSTYNSGYNSTYFVNHGFVMNRWSYMINNGAIFRPTKNFTIILSGAIGFRKDSYVANDPASFTANYNYYNRATFPLNALKLGLCIGYRF